MFFRNLTLFRFPKSGAEDLADEGLPKKLKKHGLKPCGALEMQSRGWISPFGRSESELSHQIGAFTLLTLGTEDKLLPPAVVNEHVAAKVQELTEERGKPPGGKERKRLRDEALMDLLPRAFTRPGRLSGYLDGKSGWALVDTPSRKAGEGFVTHLRETLGSFVAVPPDPEESARSLMTGWLTGAKLPEGFELGDECELRDPADKGALVRVRRLDLESAEVREHLKSGKQVTQLGLVVDERVSFVLGEDLTVRKLKFLDVVEEELEATDRESPRAELDARFALMSLTMKPVLERFEEIFRLPRPRDRRN
ncbi:MAG TPA: recombination-associated protein RdgC [Xanthomonadales bacterium]|nr:recombination-associated protein RdgC [Xanthomonadales bacterium]